jgi:lysozyme
MSNLIKVLAALGVVALLYKYRAPLLSLGSELIKSFEGLRLQSYRDSAGVWTIGYGTTVYPNGQRVQAGDTITEAQANEYFEHDFQNFASGVSKLVTVPVNPNQIAAMTSLAYNIGLGAFENSTLLRFVNQNPENPLIYNEFLRWVYANGNFVAGLLNRREQEAELYFS